MCSDVLLNSFMAWWFYLYQSWREWWEEVNDDGPDDGRSTIAWRLTSEMKNNNTDAKYAPTGKITAGEISETRPFGIACACARQRDEAP